MSNIVVLRKYRNKKQIKRLLSANILVYASSIFSLIFLSSLGTFLFYNAVRLWIEDIKVGDTILGIEIGRSIIYVGIISAYVFVMMRTLVILVKKRKTPSDYEYLDVMRIVTIVVNVLLFTFALIAVHNTINALYVVIPAFGLAATMIVVEIIIKKQE